MTHTAAKPAQIFHVDKGTFNLQNVSWFPVLERDAPTDILYLDPAGTEEITLDGQTINAVALQAYKVQHNTFIAVGR